MPNYETDVKFQYEAITLTELNEKTRAVIYTALKSLIADIERYEVLKHLYPDENNEIVQFMQQIKPFHDEIKDECERIKLLIQAASQKGSLSLFNHFGK